MTDFAAAEKSEKPRVVVVVGPTASGKSALAVGIAEALDGVVVNADSMQVYRELDVLTARPSAADLARVPHRLFGVLPAAERCSVGRWLDLALAEVEVVRAAGRLPVLAGGTGMYLKALMEGLAPVPEVPADTVARLGARYDEIGGEAFREELRPLDPENADRLPPGDRQRLVRARAVAEATGRPLGHWRRLAPAGPALAADYAVILLLPNRQALYDRCDARFGQMMASGALDEVRALLDLGLSSDLPAMRALGVPELAAYLGGETTLEAAVSKAQQATRNFAKRQLTWLRHQVRADLILTDPGESALAEALTFLCARWGL